MKKYLLYSLLGATALFTTACDEDFNEDVVPPQEWDQEEAIALPGMTAKGVENLDLRAIEDDSISVFTTTFSGAIPDSSTVGNYRISFTADKEGAKATEFSTNQQGLIAKKAIQAMIESDYGKQPVLRNYKAVVCANVITNNQASLLKSETTFSAIPKAPFISSGYYMIGNICEWNPEKMLSFNHSDKDVYEDPVFTLNFETKDKDQYWKIVPQSNVDKGNVWAKGPEGVLGIAEDGNSDATGQLLTAEDKEGAKDVGAGRIEKPGIYRMEINMMSYTYSITQIAPEYYLVGDLQGWNSDNTKGMTCTLYPTDAMHFSYTTKFEGNGNLKVWLGSEFGNWDNAMGAAVNEDQSLTGSFVKNGGAIKCPEPGSFYNFSVDFSANTYQWTKVENQTPAEFEKMGLIGIGGDWDHDLFMTQVAPHNWYFKDLKVESDTEGKFRANGNWDKNWGNGGNIADQHYGVGTNGGANNKIPAGTYNVFFNDITGEFVFKKL